MNQLLARIQELVRQGDVRLSDHAVMRMLEQHIDIQETIDGVQTAMLLEDYTVTRGDPRLLVLQRDAGGHPILAVWEAPARAGEQAVLVTAFHPVP